MPREKLEEILGLDIPPVPELSLAGITREEVLLYWKQPEDDQFSSLKFDIVVNGITGRSPNIMSEAGRADAILL
jgi:hypothetical protein